jgi:hypothetical protein
VFTVQTSHTCYLYSSVGSVGNWIYSPSLKTYNQVAGIGTSCSGAASVQAEIAYDIEPSGPPYVVSPNCNYILLNG